MRADMRDGILEKSKTAPFICLCFVGPASPFSHRKSFVGFFTQCPVGACVRAAARSAYAVAAGFSAFT